MRVLVDAKEDGLESFMAKAGIKSLGRGKKNANGPDLTVAKNRRAYTVEIKKCRVTARGSVQVQPVGPKRKNDDFIAIETPCGVIIFEPMIEHLKKCSSKGYRTLHGVFK